MFQSKPIDKSAKSYRLHKNEQFWAKSNCSKIFILNLDNLELIYTSFTQYGFKMIVTGFKNVGQFNLAED